MGSRKVDRERALSSLLKAICNRMQMSSMRWIRTLCRWPLTLLFVKLRNKKVITCGNGEAHPRRAITLQTGIRCTT